MTIEERWWTGIYPDLAWPGLPLDGLDVREKKEGRSEMWRPEKGRQKEKDGTDGKQERDVCT